MILGFGSNEKEVEANVEKAFFDKVEELYQGGTQSYFTDDLIDDVKKWADSVAVESGKMADGYKEAVDYPSRYSRFWAYVVGDCNHICLIVSFHHINRRHAFSPDGWAMLQSKRVYEVDTWEAGRSQRAGAA